MFLRFAAVLVVALAFAPADVLAHPSYVLLEPAHRAQGQHGGHTSGTNTPGYRHGVSSKGYSYGWFGVAPRRHRSRSYGYYGNHRQWTFR